MSSTASASTFCLSKTPSRASQDPCLTPSSSPISSRHTARCARTIPSSSAVACAQSSSRWSKPIQTNTALSPRTQSFTARAIPSSARTRSAWTTLAMTTLEAFASSSHKLGSSSSCLCDTRSFSSRWGLNPRAAYSCTALPVAGRHLLPVPLPTRRVLSSSLSMGRRLCPSWRVNRNRIYARLLRRPRRMLRQLSSLTKSTLSRQSVKRRTARLNVELFPSCLPSWTVSSLVPTSLSLRLPTVRTALTPRCDVLDVLTAKLTLAFLTRPDVSKFSAFIPRT
mmetsp:Transcript_37421/g.91713  ORF Transcript_37421/g.91713 Transcript_37421/m.91713 type:complete len:281 (-) Transcript_37421:1329-2171(-)